MNINAPGTGVEEFKANNGEDCPAANHQHDSDGSNIEQSYEILSDSYIKQHAAMDSFNQSDEGGKATNDDDTLLDEAAAARNSSSNTDQTDEPHNAQSKRNSFQGSRKKSGSFLSKLQLSTSSSSIGTDQHNSSSNNNNNNNSTNESPSTHLPSSFANAFSSITSSFTSSFNLGSTSNGNNSQRNVSMTSSATANNLTIETVSTHTGTSSQISETREQVLSKKATCERKNLINLTKLIVKDLISSSLNAGRTIDECHSAIHLNNYFTLLDRVLKHGLKQNLLSSKSASLWTALDNLPKYLTDKRLTSETVRSLAHTKTPDGKIKAWLRIAMMQKKLPEYFTELLANKNVLLKDIYHDFAFMMNDEVQVFAGLIIGVNVIDCNFFVKDDNFDAMDEIIDLSPYLKAANCFEEDERQGASFVEGRDDELESNLTAVLDQKNYLEERNKHLESTLTSLQIKIKQLEELNSRLEIDARVNEVRIEKLQQGDSASDGKSSTVGGFAIPDALKGFMNSSNDSKRTTSTDQATPEVSNSTPERGQPQNNAQTSPTTVEATGPQAGANTGSSSSLGAAKPEDSTAEAEQRTILADLDKFQKLCSDQEKSMAGLQERVGILETSYRGALEKIRVLERDLDIQTSMNKDKETTIKIYEKDLREKQAQVESLRASLADAKKINTELNERLSDTSAKLKDRLSSITNLQASLDKWKIENNALATRLQDKQVALKVANTDLEKAKKTMDDLKKYNEKINDDLRKERECGQSCSNQVETQTTQIGELTDRLRVVESELNELRPNTSKLAELEQKCQEYELSLEEVGYQLRESRLEVESLKENSSVFLDSQWMDSKQVKNCALCQQLFSVTRRKHHCRLCGNVFCQTCSDHKMELASSSKPARVCDTCHAFLLAKFVKSSSVGLTQTQLTNN